MAHSQQTWQKGQSFLLCVRCFILELKNEARFGGAYYIRVPICLLDHKSLPWRDGQSGAVNVVRCGGVLLFPVETAKH